MQKKKNFQTPLSPESVSLSPAFYMVFCGSHSMSPAHLHPAGPAPVIPPSHLKSNIHMKQM